MTEHRRRRWDPDPRGIGVGEATAHLATLDALREVAAQPGWVAEDPEAHLLPRLRHAAEAAGAALAIDVITTDPDGTFVVDVHWVGTGGAEPRWYGDTGADARAVRVASLALIASVAETTTVIRERHEADQSVYEVMTGALPGDSPFATHGHTLRLRVAGVSRSNP